QALQTSSLRAAPRFQHRSFSLENDLRTPLNQIRLALQVSRLRYAHPVQLARLTHHQTPSYTSEDRLLLPFFLTRSYMEMHHAMHENHFRLAYSPYLLS